MFRFRFLLARCCSELSDRLSEGKTVTTVVMSGLMLATITGFDFCLDWNVLYKMEMNIAMPPKVVTAVGLGTWGLALALVEVILSARFGIFRTAVVSAAIMTASLGLLSAVVVFESHYPFFKKPEVYCAAKIFLRASSCMTFISVITVHMGYFYDRRFGIFENPVFFFISRYGLSYFILQPFIGAPTLYVVITFVSLFLVLGYTVAMFLYLKSMPPASENVMEQEEVLSSHEVTVVQSVSDIVSKKEEVPSSDEVTVVQSVSDIVSKKEEVPSSHEVTVVQSVSDIISTKEEVPSSHEVTVVQSVSENVNDKEEVPRSHEVTVGQSVSENVNDKEEAVSSQDEVTVGQKEEITELSPFPPIWVSLISQHVMFVHIANLTGSFAYSRCSDWWMAYWMFAYLLSPILMGLFIDMPALYNVPHTYIKPLFGVHLILFLGAVGLSWDLMSLRCAMALLSYTVVPVLVFYYTTSQPGKQIIYRYACFFFTVSLLFYIDQTFNRNPNILVLHSHEGPEDNCPFLAAYFALIVVAFSTVNISCYILFLVIFPRVM